jgi:hypothetical protein
MRWKVLAVLAALAAVASLMAPAQATNFQIPLADNGLHRFNYDPPMQERWKAALERSRLNSYEVTDMTTRLECCHTTTVDVWAHSQPVANADGWARCKYYVNVFHNACDHWHVVFETANESDLAQEWYRIGMACHEIGHTVGLQHAVGGDTYQCMTSTPSTKFLGPHNVNHINLEYEPGTAVVEPAGTPAGSEPAGDPGQP